MSRTLLLAVALAGCGGAQVQPGVAIGQVRLGMPWSELRTTVGDMPDALTNNRFVIGGYKARGLDVVLTTPGDDGLVDAARVVAVGARGQGFIGTPHPGQSRAEIETLLGAAPDHAGSIDYWPAGVSVEWDTAGRASAVGVFAPYARNPQPLEMTPAPGGS